MGRAGETLKLGAWAAVQAALRAGRWRSREGAPAPSPPAPRPGRASRSRRTSSWATRARVQRIPDAAAHYAHAQRCSKDAGVPSPATDADDRRRLEHQARVAGTGSILASAQEPVCPPVSEPGAGDLQATTTSASTGNRPSMEITLNLLLALSPKGFFSLPHLLPGPSRRRTANHKAMYAPSGTWTVRLVIPKKNFACLRPDKNSVRSTIQPHETRSPNTRPKRLVRLCVANSESSQRKMTPAPSLEGTKTSEPSAAARNEAPSRAPLRSGFIGSTQIQTVCEERKCD